MFSLIRFRIGFFCFCQSDNRILPLPPKIKVLFEVSLTHKTLLIKNIDYDKKRNLRRDHLGLG